MTSMFMGSEQCYRLKYIVKEDCCLCSSQPAKCEVINHSHRIVNIKDKNVFRLLDELYSEKNSIGLL